MRLDLKVAILTGLSGLPIAVAVMAAPLYFDIPRQFVGICLFGGLAIGLILLGAAVIVAYTGENRAPVLGHKFRMISLIGMIVCGLGFFGFGAAYFWSAYRSPITFQKFVLYFVKWDDGIYRLAITGQLLNAENRLFVIDAINYHGGSWTMFPRGGHVIQRYTEFTDEPEIPDDATYLAPTSEGYIKKLLKIRIFMTSSDAAMPNLLLRGKWDFIIGKETITLSPLRFAVAINAISRQEWDALDPKSASTIKAVAIPTRPANAAPGSPEKQTFAMYLLYSPDRSATIENPYFSETNYVRSAAGVMVFVSGNATIPIEQGWAILGHTYHEAWRDPQELALYNSVYPPDTSGKPRAFGYFMGNEAAMLDGEPYSPAPVTRAGDIIELQVPQTSQN